jgi:Methyltransferase domain
MKIEAILKSLVKKLPGISRIVAHRDRLLADSGFVPPGHFLSPIVSIDEYLADEAANPQDKSKQVLAIDINLVSQLELLSSLSRFCRADMFPDKSSNASRYFSPNPAFGPSDAFIVQAMLRHFLPARVIEVGSGFSSCVILDTNEHFFDNKIHLTFIEPYPQLLKSLVFAQDLTRNTLVSSRLQDVPLSTFEGLHANDVLFIDSTHVSKTNSDVNYLFFEILPRLNSGVLVHIHDIFYPFEYPREWILEGRSWNEAYVLRAFLQYNQRFEIILFNNYLQTMQPELFKQMLPAFTSDGGASIWLKVK